MVQPPPSTASDQLSTTDTHARWRLESEDLHIRNRDLTVAHDVQVTIRRDDEVYHAADYRLRPGQSGSSVNLLPAGEYTVRASIDDAFAKTAVVRVSDEPDATIVLEIRDGSLRITDSVQ